MITGAGAVAIGAGAEAGPRYAANSVGAHEVGGKTGAGAIGAGVGAEVGAHGVGA